LQGTVKFVSVRDERVPEGVPMSAGYRPGVPASLRCGCEPGHPRSPPADAASRPWARAYHPAPSRAAGAMLGRVARVRGFNRGNVPTLSFTEAAARRACGRPVSGALLLQPRAGRGVCDGDHRLAAGLTATPATGDRCRHLADQRARCHAARPLIWRRGNSVPRGALATGSLP
jgi:hypothetical protein